MEARHIAFETSLEPNLEISGNEDRLKQLVMNLLRNSLEACEPNTGKVTVHLIKKGDSIQLSVRDNGPGIPADIRDKIFNPYFTTKDRGTGLGLSIAHRIVEEHTGSIEVNVPPEGGTEFLVTFPSK
jgi:signal transduction histidine kinase